MLMFVHLCLRGRTILLLYVDNTIIIGDGPDHSHFVKASLQRKFETKNLGHFQYFLGNVVAYGPCGYLLSQQKYIVALISRVNLFDNTKGDAPMQLHQKLTHGRPLG